jgi:hypothetical protein
MMRVIPYEELADADLVVDAVYEGGTGGHLSGEALSKPWTNWVSKGRYKPLARAHRKYE